MAYVAPTTRAAGYKVPATVWNQDVVDNVTFLANPPACRVTHSTTQSLTDNTEASVTFDTESYDTAALHSTVTNPTRITIPVAGIYLITWSFQVQSDTDYTSLYTYLRPNGSGILAVGSFLGTATENSPQLHGSCQSKFAANDYVEIRAFQNNTSGDARNITASGIHFAATWIGLG